MLQNVQNHTGFVWRRNWCWKHEQVHILRLQNYQWKSGPDLVQAGWIRAQQAVQLPAAVFLVQQWIAQDIRQIQTIGWNHAPVDQMFYEHLTHQHRRPRQTNRPRLQRRRILQFRVLVGNHAWWHCRKVPQGNRTADAQVDVLDHSRQHEVAQPRRKRTLGAADSQPSSSGHINHTVGWKYWRGAYRIQQTRWVPLGYRGVTRLDSVDGREHEEAKGQD